jgi:hypothetical protein
MQMMSSQHWFTEFIRTIPFNLYPLRTQQLQILCNLAQMSSTRSEKHEDCLVCLTCNLKPETSNPFFGTVPHAPGGAPLDA